MWVSSDVLAAWNACATNGKRGHPQTYTDTAILCMASLQEVYHLPLRATEGLLSSVVKLLKITVGVSCYTTLSSATTEAGSRLAQASEECAAASGGGFDRRQNLWRR